MKICDDPAKGSEAKRPRLGLLWLCWANWSAVCCFGRWKPAQADPTRGVNSRNRLGVPPSWATIHQVVDTPPNRPRRHDKSGSTGSCA